jgi:hypothetical protein
MPGMGWDTMIWALADNAGSTTADRMKTDLRKQAGRALPVHGTENMNTPSVE